MKIVKYPHPALRAAAKPVASIDRDVQVVAGQMLDLMYKHEGLGLAAPQVDFNYQLLVMNFDGKPDRKDMEYVAINPVIVESKGSINDREGCLSFPGLYQNVRRAKSVKVQAYNLEGEALRDDLFGPAGPRLATRDRPPSRRVVHRQDGPARPARQQEGPGEVHRRLRTGEEEGRVAAGTGTEVLTA